ncbi:MAG: CinA family protein [Hyphomonadaceae bacterium]
MDTLIPIAERIAERLKARGEKIAVAESSTGGLISAALLAIPGASAYFIAGGVVYTPKARGTLMALSKDDVVGMRSASEPYALKLAQTARDRFGADWGLSETGASGPTGNGYGDAAGHSCIAIAGATLELSLTIETGDTDRVRNMRAFAHEALSLLERALTG